MKHSEKTEKIDAALAKCQSLIKPAIKNMAQSHFGSQYADLKAVAEAAREPMATAGIAFVATPQIREWITTAEKVTPGENGAEPTLIKRQEVLHKEVMVARITHDGEWYEGEAFLKMKGQDDSPQAFGSASTYARRYLLSTMLNITAEGEDDDGEAAEGRASKPDKKRPVMTKAKQKEDVI